MYPDTDKKEILARSIVTTFPQLGCESTPEEPHILYFHRLDLHANMAGAVGYQGDFQANIFLFCTS